MHTHLPMRSVTVGIGAELEHAAIADLQFLDKAAVGLVSGRQCRDRDFVPGLQAAAVSPAHPGFAERGRSSHFERPLLRLAVRALYIHREVRMRIDELYLCHGSTDGHGFVNVELRLDRMMRRGRSGE